MSVYVEPERADFWQLYKEPGTDRYLDPLGPKNCMTHTASRAAMRANEGKRPVGATGVWPPTGYAIRTYCRNPDGSPDVTGGINHGQIQRVLADRYKTSLTTKYGFDVDDVPGLLEETRGVMFSLWYEPILESRFRGSFSFRENHEFWISGVNRERRVYTGVVDPLADARQKGLFKGPGEYPISLLREAAGMLNIASVGYRALGQGKVYIAYTKATGDYEGPPADPVIDYGGTPMNILDGPAATALLTQPVRHMFLRKGTPIYEWVSARTSNEITRMSRDQQVVMTGIPASGWRTVVVQTANFADGRTRIVEAYVPVSAGPIS